MKKTQFIPVILIVLGISASTMTFGQTHHGSHSGNGPVTPVELGDIIVNLGVGVGADYKGDNYGTAFGTKIALEKAMWQAGPGVITIGGELGGSFYSGDRYDNYRAQTIVAAVRAAWHYGWQVPGLDTYAGVSAGLGFHHYSYKNPDYSHSSVIPAPGAFVGASYFVTSNFGFNAEAGYDITSVQIGLVFKLN